LTQCDEHVLTSISTTTTAISIQEQLQDCNKREEIIIKFRVQSRTNNSINMDTDEDETLWETLEHDEQPEPLESVTRIQQEAPSTTHVGTSTATVTIPDATHASTQTPQPSQPSQSSSLPPRIQKIKRRLETRASLKQSLVDHPMQLFGSHFFVHFARELWQLDVQIRAALVLIFTGATIKLCLLCTWYLFYPRWILALALLVIPWCCLHPDMLRDMFESFLAAYSSPVLAADAISRFLEPAQLRNLATALLFVPTILEMRTLHFLSHIQVQQQQDSYYWSLYNCTIAGIILAVMSYLCRVQHCAPRECTQKGLLVLYLSALLQTVVHCNNVLHMMLLLGPFLAATGVLILSNLPDDDMEWFANAVRNALRLTLQDVLASVSVQVQQDEMLQLAMLRWIVDYWSHEENDNSNSNDSSHPTPAPTRSRSDETPNDGLGRIVRRAATSPPPSNESTRSSSSNSLVRARAGPHHEIQWNELWSMLEMTTQQMAAEVDTLQHVNVADASERRPTQSEPPSTQQSTSRQRSDDSTRSTGSTRASATPAMGSGARSSSASAAPSNYDSVQGLRSMLSSMDIDEHAKPAVLAYKRGIVAFPPSRNTTVLLSVARRCPALLTVLVQIVFCLSGSLTCTAILFPFILFEMLRIQAWSDACQRSSSNMQANDLSTTSKDETTTTTYIGNLDPMTILLSGDDYSTRNPPTLLVVWRNMCDSASALEVGLTAARCVQTTVVAVDFASNIMSLAQFGFDVSRQGWGYGLAVVLQEMLVLHTNSNSTPGSRNRHPDAKYTNAARDALTNSQRVSRNVRVLMYEEDVGRVLAPIVTFMHILLGQGWLWAAAGQERIPSPSTKSTVEITELEESDNLLAQPDTPTADEVYTGNSSIRSIVLEDADACNLEPAPPVAHSLSETEREALSPHQPSITVEPEELTGKETECLSDLSVIMELIAACDERDLLSEADKNRFLENLATVGGEKGPSVEWLEGSTRTLQGLLDIHSDDTVTSIEEPCHQEDSRPPIEDAVSTEQQQQDREIPKTCVLEAHQHFDRHVEDDDVDFEPLDSGDDIARRVGGPQRTGSLPPENSATPRDSKTGGHTASAEAGLRESDDSPKSHRSDDEDENIWLKVGSGIAVLGAVVGGVALAMGQQGNDQSSSQARRQNRSTVQIEELNDNDEGEDEWVAVSSSPSI
jgi:hypothetical protein